MKKLVFVLLILAFLVGHYDAFEISDSNETDASIFK